MVRNNTFTAYKIYQFSSFVIIFFFTDNQLSLIFSKPVPKLSHFNCYQLDKVLHNIAFDCFHGIEHKILYNTESKISKQTFGILYTAISWI